jgi:probable F420-dependent oxidoreductase
MVKLGAVFPQTEISAKAEDIRRFISEVEGMGYDFLLAYDHVLGANPEREGGWTGPYTHKSQFHEVFTLFAYAAAITTRLELAAGVLVLPQRQAVLAAKQAAEVDVLSGGRMRLGVGVGWNKVELEGMGEKFGNRGKRIAEQVRLMQRLWTEELVKFDGDFHTIDDAGLNPLPIQRPIPVWFGGRAEAVIERMAELGAGWMPGGMSPEAASEILTKLHEALKEEGRNPADFGIDPFIPMSRLPNGEHEAYIEKWRALGATHLSVVTMGQGFTSLDQHLKQLQDVLSIV